MTHTHTHTRLNKHTLRQRESKKTQQFLFDKMDKTCLDARVTDNTECVLYKLKNSLPQQKEGIIYIWIFRKGPYKRCIWMQSGEAVASTPY